VAPVVVSSSVTALENFERLNDGTADLAFSFANVAYGESLGHVPGRSAALTPTRAIALLQHATLHFVTAPHSPVRTVGDLRGRRASFGSRSGSAVTVNVVLRAFGLNPTTIQSRSGIDEDITALLGGRLDAMFMLGTQPSSSVQKAIAGGAQLLALRGPEIEQLLRQYPFYSALVIPPGTYEGLSKPVVTIGVNGVLLCRGDLDDDTVYRLTKAMYEAAPGSPADQVLAHWVDVSIGAATPIPLHPGAARYYRERELSP
jgi:TRAP transporter TAXI family solute receptor